MLAQHAWVQVGCAEELGDDLGAVHGQRVPVYGVGAEVPAELVGGDGAGDDEDAVVVWAGLGEVVVPGVGDAERGLLVGDDDAAVPAADPHGELGVLLPCIPDSVDQDEPVTGGLGELGLQEHFDGAPTGDGAGGHHRPPSEAGPLSDTGPQKISTGACGWSARNASISSRTAVRSSRSAAGPGAMTRRRGAGRGVEPPEGAADSRGSAGPPRSPGSARLGPRRPAGCRARTARSARDQGRRVAAARGPDAPA